VKSPAKLNLSLEVLGKRPDGYHEIRSLMIPIDRFDDITIRLEGEGIECVCDHPDAPGGPKNLAYRAAEAFMRATGERFGVRISIEKHIPVGAGLGGGSGNAATVLKELNRLKGEPLCLQEMLDLAAGIGSDVPFFLKEGAQWAEGRGERLRDGPDLPFWTYLVVFPGFEISAEWAYNNMPLTFEEKVNRIYYFKSERIRLVNHLEAAVLAVYPEVGKLKDCLLAVGAWAALMTGSGPSVFGVFDNRAVATEASRSFGDHPKAMVFLAQELKHTP